jgi:hypothetical protein
LTSFLFPFQYQTPGSLLGELPRNSFCSLCPNARLAVFTYSTQTAKTVFAWTKIMKEQKLFAKNENSAFVVAMLLPQPQGRRVVKLGHPYLLSLPYCSPCGIFYSCNDDKKVFVSPLEYSLVRGASPGHILMPFLCRFQREIIRNGNTSRESRARNPHLFAVVFYGYPRPPPPSPDTIAMDPLMDQITKKTPNLKCRLFFKIDLQRDLAAGVHLSEAT